MRPVAGVVLSQKNREGIKLKPTQKSTTASETIKLINSLVLVRRSRLLQTRKIVNPFPMMVRNERNQPRILNQVSILTVKGSSCQLYWLTKKLSIIIYIFAWIWGSHLLIPVNDFTDARGVYLILGVQWPRGERLIDVGSLKEESVWSSVKLVCFGRKFSIKRVNCK